MKTFIKGFSFVLLSLISFQAFADNASEGDRLHKLGKYQQAMAFFMKPDAQKKPEVMNHIGYMYDYGQGVEKNEAMAFHWYRKAAELGYAKSQYNLGQCYEYGRGVPKNTREAIIWFRKAANQKYANAESKMGYFTATGKGIEQDLPEALRWYRLAAEHGDVSSYADIGIFYAKGYGVKKNKNRAVQYYIMGAEKGDPYAQYLLGRAYEQGRGIKYSPERSLYWLEKAAANGSALAMDELVIVYANGLLNQTMDSELAKMWAEKASQRRRITGETHPDIDRRLRFFGVDVDKL